MLYEQRLIPHIRTFKIENIPRIKISLIDEKSKLDINRILMTSESNSLIQKDIKYQDQIELRAQQLKEKNIIDDFENEAQSLSSPRQDNQPTIDASSSSPESIFNKKLIQYQNILPSLQTQQKMNVINHREPPIVIYNNERRLPSSVISQEQKVPRRLIDEHQLSSSEDKIKGDILSSIIQIEQTPSTPLSQIIPDSIINDKQTTNRIFNELNSTFVPRIVTSTSVITEKNVSSFKNHNSHQKHSELIADDISLLNHVRRYQSGSILTSTSTFIMHHNDTIAAQATAASDPFLSDTIFIILIATLIIITLLFCLGLFCLCRRTTRRNISPSFDGGGSYAGLNGHSFEIPIGSYQQRVSKYENDLPYITDISSMPSMNHLSLTNDGILLPQTIALHHTAKQKANINKNKLKKKRVGFCCCSHSKQTPSTTVNARTRMKKIEM